MINQELLKWIKNSREAGNTDQEIKTILLENKWPEVEIDEALAKNKNSATETAVPTEVNTANNNSDSDELSQKTITEIFKEVWAILATHWKKLAIVILGPSVVVTIIALLAIVILSGVTIFNMAGLLSSESSNIDFSSLFMPGMGMLVGFLILAMIIMLASQIASIIFLHYREENIKVGTAFKQAFAKIIPLLVAGLMQFLFIMIGLVFLILPGLVLAVLFMHVPYLVILNDLKGIKALTTSVHYTKMWFKNFKQLWHYLAVAIIISLVSQIFVNLTSEITTALLPVQSEFIQILIDLIILPAVTLMQAIIGYLSFIRLKQIVEWADAKKEIVESGDKSIG